MAHLFLTEDYLKKTTVLGDAVDMKVLTPVIEWCQDIYMMPLVGQDLYELLMTQDIANNLSVPNATLFNNYFAKCLRFYVLAESVRTQKYKYTKQGILVNKSEVADPISDDEMEKLIDDWKSKAETYGEIMINFIFDHPGDYPTYWTIGGVYHQKPRSTAYDSPLSFASKNRGRYYNTDLDKRWDTRD